MGGDHTSRIIAFDVFSNKYPNTKFKEDKIQRKHWIKTAGSSSISANQLKYVFKNNSINNFEIIAGDFLKTVPKFKKNNPGLKISLLNIDIDFIEPTLICLKHFYECVSKGGVILLDNYAGRGVLENHLIGDTSYRPFLKIKRLRFKNFIFQLDLVL